MDKNKREKDLLYQWGIENTEIYKFPSIDEYRKSYFIKRGEETYIREYGFETVPELYDKLTEIWDSDDFMRDIEKIVAVAAMKNVPSYKSESVQIQDHDLQKSGEKLPMYIYNF